MNRLLSVALLALALLLAPAPLRAQDAPAPEAPKPEESKPAETDDQVLERITGEMLTKVEEIRGLKFKHDVKRVWKSRDEAKAEMLEDIEEELPADKLRALSMEAAFFGLVKEGTDLKEMFSEFISAGAGGYYKPKTKVFSLVRGFSEDASRPIVFHELIHAVEDQYYDYHARQEKLGDDDMSDGSAAIQAIVEGSARYWEDRFVDGEPGLRVKYFEAQSKSEGVAESTERIMDLPPAIIIAMIFYPYGNGSAFHHEVIPAMTAKGDVSETEAFDRIFANPPSSTEQILHPAKYLGSDLPRTIAVPDFLPLLGEGWEKLGGDTQGEFGMGLVINAALLPANMQAQALAAMRMPKQGELKTQEDAIRFQMTPVVEYKGETAKAITGWDGDRYLLAGKGERMCLGWVSVWDTEEDAAEFAATYGKVLERKYSISSETTGEDGTMKKTRVKPVASDMANGEWTGKRWKGTRDGDSAILVKGDRVVIVERGPEDRVEALVGKLIGAEVVRDPKDTVPAK